MAEFIEYNANPRNKRVGDCTIRAISTALGQDWFQTYLDMSLQGLAVCDMPSANHVWGAYLKSKGFERHLIPDTCPNCYTVKDFCEDNSKGTFILAISGHVVTVIDGNYYDSGTAVTRYPFIIGKRRRYINELSVPLRLYAKLLQS